MGAFLIRRNVYDRHLFNALVLASRSCMRAAMRDNRPLGAEMGLTVNDV